MYDTEREYEFEMALSELTCEEEYDDRFDDYREDEEPVNHDRSDYDSWDEPESHDKYMKERL